MQTNCTLSLSLFCSFCCLLLTLNVAQAQTIRYVKPTGAGTGTSWADASADLQAIINASQPGDQVWVARGQYQPVLNQSFALKDGVAIYGGFQGDETDLSSRPAVNPVTDSHTIGTPSSATLAGNGSRVITNPSGLTTSAVLDGFVITGGSNVTAGGGMYNEGSSPSLHNCLFTGNSVTAPVGNGSINHAFGGAIYNAWGDLTLTNCSLQSNTVTASVAGTNALYGGAIYNSGGGRVVLTNCSLQNNAIATSVGGVNSAFGGAIYNDYGCSATLTNCSLQSNSNTVSGGSGNFAVGGAIFNFGSVVLINCSLQSNTVTASGGGINNAYGGALYNFTGSLTLTNSVFWNNGAGNTFYDYGASPLPATYCLFDNTVTGYTGSHNQTTSISPFVSVNSVALAACSPAINAGTPASITVASGPYSETALPQTDLSANPRIVGGRVDMGAVEYQSPSGVSLVIVQQPVASSVVCAANSVVVSVSVTGSASAYQWYKSGTALTGIASATTASLTLANVQTSDQGSYSVVITGDCLNLTSTAFSLTVNALPSVMLAANPSLTLTCTNSSLTLTAQTSATTFAWSSGSNTGQTLPVSQSGVYSVTVTDGNGCQSSTAQTVSTGQSLPTVSVSASVSVLTCANPSLTLTATSSATALRWSTGATTASIPVSTTGTYSVTATGANGCVMASNSLNISKDTDSPTVSVSAAGSVLNCAYPSLTLTATSSATALRWSTNQTSASIPVSTSGTYSVTATGANGCTAVSNSFSVSQDFTGLGSTSLTASASAFSCQSASILLTATPGASTYRFSGPGLSQSGPANTVTVSTSGVYSVTAGTGICSATATLSLAGAPGIPPNALLLGTGNLSCATPTLSLTALGGSSYVFSGPGVVSQTDGRERIVVGDYVIFRTLIPTIGTAVVSKPGQYTVVVTNDAGCSAVATILVTGSECR